MLKFSLLIILTLTLTSCSLLNPITSMFSKKPSIEVNANLGKNINTDKSMLKVETGTQNADKISNDTAYQADTINQITNNLTPLQLLIIVICAGAALPSFREMYLGVKVVVRDVLQTLIVYPVKAVGDFILKVLDRKPKL